MVLLKIETTQKTWRWQLFSLKGWHILAQGNALGTGGHL
jgi:hypothetical protein